MSDEPAFCAHITYGGGGGGGGGPGKHSRCPDDEFTCRNRKCVDRSRICDGRDDCDDASDEDLFLCRK